MSQKDGNIRKAWPITKVAASREDRARLGLGSRPQWQSDSPLRRIRGAGSSAPASITACVCAFFFSVSHSAAPRSDAGCNPSPRQEHTTDRRTMDSAGSRCKIVVVGDTQCGKTALLHVFAKDCYPEVSLPKSLKLFLFVLEDEHTCYVQCWITSALVQQVTPAK